MSSESMSDNILHLVSQTGTYDVNVGTDVIKHLTPNQVDSLIKELISNGKITTHQASSQSYVIYKDNGELDSVLKNTGGSRRRRPSRKYKKSAKRVFRKKSRSTRRR